MIQNPNELESRRSEIQNEIREPVPGYEDEINLADILNVLWRRKWIMLCVTALVVGLGLIYCYLATPKYRITAQVGPGITGFNKDGDPVNAVSVADIQTWFEKESYIEALLPLSDDKDALPEVNASAGRGSTMVSLDFDSPRPEEGKKILKSIIDFLRESGSEVGSRHIAVSRKILEEEISGVERNLKLVPVEKSRIDDDIALQKNKALVIQAELTSIKKNMEETTALIERMRKQIDVINTNTSQLMKLREGMTEGDSDKFALLMYSNIIQQNIEYVTNLEQRISDLDKLLNDFAVQAAERSEQLKNIEIKINDLMVKRDQESALKEEGLVQRLSTLKTKIAALYPIQVIQPPFSTPKPVKPAKLEILALSIVLGGFLGLIAAFMTEFIAKSRKQIFDRHGNNADRFGTDELQ